MHTHPYTYRPLRPPHGSATLTNASCPLSAATLHVQPAIDFFESLLATRLPALAAHISSLGIPTDAYLVPWLLTLFARSLPLSTASRIWDRVLAEGEGETFRAAIALMQLLQPVLLLAGFEEALQLLQQLPFGQQLSVGGGGASPIAGGHADAPSPLSTSATVTRARAAEAHQLALAARLAEAALLEAMSKVQLPKIEFEQLMMRCIAHAPS